MKPVKRKNPHAVALGRLGGSKNTPAQQEAHRKAMRDTATLGRKYRPCKESKDKRGIHAWNKKDVCWYCGLDRETALLKRSSKT
jgi:hypothetical protein